MYAYTPTSHGRLQRGGGDCGGATEDRLSSSNRRQVGEVGGSEDGGGVGEAVGEAVDETA